MDCVIDGLRYRANRTTISVPTGTIVPAAGTCSRARPLPTGCTRRPAAVRLLHDACADRRPGTPAQPRASCVESTHRTIRARLHRGHNLRSVRSFQHSRCASGSGITEVVSAIRMKRRQHLCPAAASSCLLVAIAQPAQTSSRRHLQLCPLERSPPSLRHSRADAADRPAAGC